MNYSVFIRGNANKKTYHFRVEDKSDSREYHIFNLDLDSLENGEYDIYVIRNERDDVEIELNNNILESLLIVGDTKFKLKDLNPEADMLRIGEINDGKIYQNKNKDYIYRD